MSLEKPVAINVPAKSTIAKEIKIDDCDQVIVYFFVIPLTFESLMYNVESQTIPGLESDGVIKKDTYGGNSKLTLTQADSGTMKTISFTNKGVTVATCILTIPLVEPKILEVISIGSANNPLSRNNNGELEWYAYNTSVCLWLQFKMNRRLQAAEKIYYTIYVMSPGKDSFDTQNIFGGQRNELKKAMTKEEALRIGVANSTKIITPVKTDILGVCYTGVYTIDGVLPERFAGAKIAISFGLINPLSPPFKSEGKIAPTVQRINLVRGQKDADKEKDDIKNNFIKQVLWSKKEDCAFGENAPTEHQLNKDEDGFLHIHTRGMYGKKVKIWIYRKGLEMKLLVYDRNYDNKPNIFIYDNCRSYPVPMSDVCGQLLKTDVTSVEIYAEVVPEDTSILSVKSDILTLQIQPTQGRQPARSTVAGCGTVKAGHAPTAEDMKKEKKKKAGYDIDKAVAHLNEKAYPEYDKEKCGKCAKFVRLAIEAGGINTSVHPIPAKDYDSYLQKWGFTKIDKTGYTKIKGDIRVFQNYQGGNENGHIDMYNGTQWVSDFFEKRDFPSNGYEKANDYTIYRWE